MKHFLLVGLGNPGKQFMGTRHNLGQDVISHWVAYVREQGADVSAMKQHEKLHAMIQEITYGDSSITVLFPNVFMNDSGKAVAQYLRYHELDRSCVIIVHDDLELALGSVVYQESGSAHGHNGVRSVHEYLGDTNVPQLRIGIGRPSDAMPIDRFVLSQFTPDEKDVLAEKMSDSVSAILNIISQNQLQE